MAESRTVIIPLNGKNFPTWKVQCKMALMREALWSIVSGTETAPTEREAEIKFVRRRDRALATIVLSLDPSLLYLLGTDPEDPAVVWKKLEDQFQKKTWANKLALRRKLYTLRLKDGESVQGHIKAILEIFDSLAAVGDAVSEEDRVVHLLASLPESFSVLVTALEANAEVPRMETVTERLLHEEMKLKERRPAEQERHSTQEKAMTSHSRKKGPKCHHCGRFGHIKRNCWELKAKTDGDQKDGKGSKHKAYKAQVKQREHSDESDESSVLVVSHALSVSSIEAQDSWVIDSGATSHMCNDEKLFVELCSLDEPQEVTLGDGHTVEATGVGVVALEMTTTKRSNLQDVLYVPDLSFNLLSVSKAAKSGKTVEFSEAGCEIVDVNRKLIATGTRVGSLYYLNCRKNGQRMNAAAEKESRDTKESIWHRRYGHLGAQSLKKLAKEDMVDGLDLGMTKKADFCEPCAEGKLHRSKFPTEGGRRSEEALGLVHSDVCGKIHPVSLGGGEYFVTFIDDKSRYVWAYIMKSKDEVFRKFQEWKALVEKSTGRKLKVLRSDNGGEYLSTEFKNYLKAEGIRHELTVPKTPQQNGVAERMNRTLMETVRSMLSDARLPHSFWAEALSTAVYLRNRSPTTAVNGMTPYQAWTGEKPRVSHLRVFGCAAYAHVPKDERQKLDPKARKCIFLGYGTETKGYRLYDPERRRVFHSRDVLFNETCKPGLQEETQVKLMEDQIENPLHVELDCVSEEIEQETPELRRSGRAQRPPDHYGEWVTIAHDEVKEPQTVKEALTSSSKGKWQKAMERELESLRENEVWDLVELPKDRKAVGSKWVFKVKTDADGSVERHKARLVAQGFSQTFGLDYDETFCPVVRFESVRTVIALAAQHGLQLHQMDVTTAYS